MREAAISIRAVGEFERRAVRWLWPGRIPLGKLTILSGDPSLGKSFVTLDLAARVGWPDEPESRGQESEVRGQEPEVTEEAVSGRRSAFSRSQDAEGEEPEGEPRRHGDTENGGERGRVLLLAAEDDVCDTIRPRLEAAGADLGRVHVVEGLRDAEGNRGFVALHRDCDVLADLLRERGDWRLIVIDPISAYFDGMDPNSNADVRIVMGRLADLAEETGAAVVVVSHHRKGRLQRAGDSQDDRLAGVRGGGPGGVERGPRGSRAVGLAKHLEVLR